MIDEKFIEQYKAKVIEENGVVEIKIPLKDKYSLILVGVEIPFKIKDVVFLQKGRNKDIPIFIKNGEILYNPKIENLDKYIDMIKEILKL